MTVTTELAKGDVPPVNPFLRGAPLRYYWMSHFLSGALYRNAATWGVTAEQVVLINGLVFGLAAVAFSLCSRAAWRAQARDSRPSRLRWRSSPTATKDSSACGCCTGTGAGLEPGQGRSTSMP